MKPVLVLIAFIAANIPFAEAQQPKKVPHIGYVNSSPLTSLERTRAEAFRQGLRDLGYVEGKTSELSGDMEMENEIV